MVRTPSCSSHARRAVHAAQRAAVTRTAAACLCVADAVFPPPFSQLGNCFQAPLHNAAKSGDAARARAALDGGADVDSKDQARAGPHCLPEAQLSFA